ncbi:MAG: two-component regulator propeller domain-containing protein [Bacteroidota bacterium]
MKNRYFKMLASISLLMLWPFLGTVHGQTAESFTDSQDIPQWMLDRLPDQQQQSTFQAKKGKTAKYWSHFNPQNTGTNPLSGARYGPVMEDSQGRLWIVEDGSSITLKGVGWMNIPSERMPISLPSGITSLAQPPTTNYSNDLSYVIGSSSGLFWLDSSMMNSQEYDTTNSNIKRNDINDLHFSGGTLWIAHGYSINRYYDSNGQLQDTTMHGGLTKSTYLGSFQPIPDQDFQGNVLEIAEDSEGTLWLAVAPDSTEDRAGLVKHDPQQNTWDRFHNDNSDLPTNLVTGVMVDNSDNVWVGLRDTNDTSNKPLIAQFDGTNWNTWSADDGLAGNITREMLQRSESGNIWIATDEGMYSFDGSTWSAVSNNDPDLKLGDTNHAIETRDGRVITATTTDYTVLGGVGTYESGSWSYISPKTDNGLPLNDIFASAKDADGNMWFSGFYGLVKYDGHSWTHFDRTDGMYTSYAWSMLYDSQGRLWLGTQEDQEGNGALTYYKDGTFHTLQTPQGPFFGEDIFEDSQGNIWFGSYNFNSEDGVLMYDGNNFTQYNKDNGLPGYYFEAIGELPNGNIVVTADGTQNGRQMYQFDGSTWSTFTIDGDNPYIYNIQVDDQGNTWFSGNSYLYKWDGSNWTKYGDKDGYSGIANEMAVTDEGNLWLASYGGAQVFDGQSFHTFSTSHVPNSFYTVYEGKNNDIWFGAHGGGITRYAESEDLSVEAVNDLPADEGGFVRIDVAGFLLDPYRVETQAGEAASWNVWRKDGENWISVGSSPISRAQTNTIDVSVPTTMDSDQYSEDNRYIFRISAHHQDGSIIAYSDTLGGYAIDNKAPAKVKGLSKTDQESGVEVSWNPVEAKDLEEYEVYLLDNDGSLAENPTKTSTSSSVIISETSSDRDFVVKAKDRHGNRGPASDPVTITSIGDGQEATPEAFTLKKNYPNPFNPTTTVPFALPEAADVTINVYNILGHRVATLTDQRYSAGQHQVSFEASRLASGTYIIKAQLGDQVFERKMMLLK